ncbi:MAG: hypothetical protein IJV35_00160 [Neisseriaceae bacterium]|nr:hypothetical protein [Neisseriaceae bacterium]
MRFNYALVSLRALRSKAWQSSFAVRQNQRRRRCFLSFRQPEIITQYHLKP